MDSVPIASLRPRRPHAIEVLPEEGERVEVVVDRSRRLRLRPDAHWLLERIDGHADMAAIAVEISRRFGREVSVEDAMELVRGTLGVHGLVEFPAEGRAAASRPMRRGGRWTLVPAESMRAVARALAPAAHPAVALGALTVALVALALAGRQALIAGVAPWRSPLAWALALPLTALSLLVHEAGHAAALVRAGGTPGGITLVLSRGRHRIATTLAGLDALSSRARAAVDVAGPIAQFGCAGAIALAAGAAHATVVALPAIALVATWALANLVPLPGSDGRWLLDDLAGRDPADVVRHPVSPIDWLQRATLRLTVHARIALGRVPLRAELDVLPVLVSASFPEWSAGRLRRHAREFAASRMVDQLDQRALPRGARAHEVRHVRAVRTLLEQRRGAVVCAMHVGPYAYVCETLMRLGVRLMAYAAHNQQRMWAETWGDTVQRQGWDFELLSPASTRDAVRAIRGLREGAMLFVLIDGQAGAQRDQHRADFRFLGNDLYMRTGAALIARRAGVPLLMASSRYEGVARRVVEFADPLPPPVSDDDAALVARTSEMFAWFEPRVERYSPQWDGWVWPVAHWRATGGAPTATPEAIDAAMRDARAALEGRGAGARVVAEPTRVQWMRTRDERIVVHAPTRRVLVVSPLACGVLDAAFRRTRVADLPRVTGAGVDALAPELARMTLAGLVALER